MSVHQNSGTAPNPPAGAPPRPLLGVHDFEDLSWEEDRDLIFRRICRRGRGSPCSGCGAGPGTTRSATGSDATGGARSAPLIAFRLGAQDARCWR